MIKGASSLSLETDGNTSFLRAARAGQLDKVLEYLKQNIDINTSNSNGLNALHLASKDGHVEVVKELLSRGAAVDAATKKGNTALHIASLAGQEEVVKLLIQHGASVNVQSQNGFTPLYMAAQENHDNVVKCLLTNGANQSLATEDGFTPLAVAMQQGHEKVVTVLLENDTRGKVRLPALHIAAKKDDVKAAKLLLENDHNPDVTSKSGFTPLHIASHYGNESIANLLIQKGADVNYTAKHNISPLHVAAKWGKTNMVSLLLEKGGHIEAKTRDGLTPLHCAARSGHEQVVDILLEKGAPISSKTKNGLAPLHMAAQGDHIDAARILIYHRAPVDEVTVDYLTALHVAAHCGHVRVAKLLLDRGADANARALNGFTPLHIACKKNRIKVVELLLKHGGSIEATTESGLTPLHVASFMGCMNIVIYLLQHNANPDVPTVRGETPLHLAARANQTDIIRILLRNGANVDSRAREQQTPLHIASRLGNIDIVMLLLQHGAKVDITTKDMYTALHIASKEGQDEVVAVLIDNGASVNVATKKGFTPLHLAAKYGHIKVTRLLLQKEAPVDAQGKNGVTPLHVASHYDHQNVALLLLDKGASPHAAAKNGHTPLHIAAKKDQMDIANTLLEYGADSNIESKAGFTPLHLSAQEGHRQMSSLLLEHKGNPNSQAKNGLTPMHLCAQEDRVPVAEILFKEGASVDSQTKSGYTPLHIASHYGQINMIRFLLNNGANVKSVTNLGYTPLHQAAQQGHTLIVNILLKNKASPNAVNANGQTPLNIAQKLGYISVIETLKIVTETTITTTTVTTVEEKYKVVAPEAMQETFMSDSEEEGGEDTVLTDHAYRYLTADEMKSLGDDSLPIDVTRDEKIDSNKIDSNTLPPQAIDESVSPQHINQEFIDYARKYTPDNIYLKQPINIGFLVSFLVDARGGAMRGCRHSGVRIIVPPRCAASPTRITCRYVRPQRTPHPPPLMEGEALASRVLELGPVGAKFLGPVIIEVPHFAALRGKEREIVILRSDNGETWREHTIDAAEEIMNDVLSTSFEEDDLNQLEDPSSGRITRIVTNDFPQYFAVVTRIHQEVHAIGPEGGMVSSTVVPQVQAVFPQGALTKKIKVGLQAQPIDPELTAKLLGHGVAVSPVVTVEPRRRKFHKAITLSMPAPRAHSQGMINQYSGSAPTLRLLCSITGGTTRAQWEDVTGSTPLTFVNDCVSFTTTVSARFWLMDCRNVGDATKMATELYREAIHVPFMAKFVVFAKRVDPLEARLRVFCMTDDKEDKTLEQQEHFTEVAKSRDVEVLEGKPQYIEFAGNLLPITKSGEQLQFSFRAFRENRLPFSIRVKDQHAEAVGRSIFMREPKVPKGDPPQQPICILNIVLPDDIVADAISLTDTDSFKKSEFMHDEFEYYMPDPRLSDMSNLLGDDWVRLAAKLGLTTSEINVIKSEYPDSVAKQAQSMLRMWRAQTGHGGHSNILESALKTIEREDIIEHCLRLQSSVVSSKEDQGNVNFYENGVLKKSENEAIKVIPKMEGDYKRYEKYETKYSAEEKTIDESDDEETFKKSVIERRHVIERKMSLDRSAPSSQRMEIVQEISTIKSLVEDKVAEAEEKQKSNIKPFSIKVKQDDLVEEPQIKQRSEKLLEDVSQRLVDEEKHPSTNVGPHSLNLSKTPPPSPADFILKEKTVGTEKDKPEITQDQPKPFTVSQDKKGINSQSDKDLSIFDNSSHVIFETAQFVSNEKKYHSKIETITNDKRPQNDCEVYHLKSNEKGQIKKNEKGLIGSPKTIVRKSSDSESDQEDHETKHCKKYWFNKTKKPSPLFEVSTMENAVADLKIITMDSEIVANQADNKNENDIQHQTLKLTTSDHHDNVKNEFQQDCSIDTFTVSESNISKGQVSDKEAVPNYDGQDEKKRNTRFFGFFGKKNKRNSEFKSNNKKNISKIDKIEISSGYQSTENRMGGDLHEYINDNRQDIDFIKKTKNVESPLNEMDSLFNAELKTADVSTETDCSNRITTEVEPSLSSQNEFLCVRQPFQNYQESKSETYHETSKNKEGQEEKSSKTNDLSKPTESEIQNIKPTSKESVLKEQKESKTCDDTENRNGGFLRIFTKKNIKHYDKKTFNINEDDAESVKNDRKGSTCNIYIENNQIILDEPNTSSNDELNTYNLTTDVSTMKKTGNDLWKQTADKSNSELQHKYLTEVQHSQNGEKSKNEVKYEMAKSNERQDSDFPINIREVSYTVPEKMHYIKAICKDSTDAIQQQCQEFETENNETKVLFTKSNKSQLDYKTDLNSSFQKNNLKGIISPEKINFTVSPENTKEDINSVKCVHKSSNEYSKNFQIVLNNTKAFLNAELNTYDLFTSVPVKNDNSANLNDESVLLSSPVEKRNSIEISHTHKAEKCKEKNAAVTSKDNESQKQNKCEVGSNAETDLVQPMKLSEREVKNSEPSEFKKGKFFGLFGKKNKKHSHKKSDSSHLYENTDERYINEIGNINTRNKKDIEVLSKNEPNDTDLLKNLSECPGIETGKNIKNLTKSTVLKLLSTKAFDINAIEPEMHSPIPEIYHSYTDFTNSNLLGQKVHTDEVKVERCYSNIPSDHETLQTTNNEIEETTSTDEFINTEKALCTSEKSLLQPLQTEKSTFTRYKTEVNDFYPKETPDFLKLYDKEEKKDVKSPEISFDSISKYPIANYDTNISAHDKESVTIIDNSATDPKHSNIYEYKHNEFFDDNDLNVSLASVKELTLQKQLSFTGSNQNQPNTNSLLDNRGANREFQHFTRHTNDPLIASKDEVSCHNIKKTTRNNKLTTDQSAVLKIKKTLEHYDSNLNYENTKGAEYIIEKNSNNDAENLSFESYIEANKTAIGEYPIFLSEIQTNSECGDQCTNTWQVNNREETEVEKHEIKENVPVQLVDKNEFTEALVTKSIYDNKSLMDEKLEKLGSLKSEIEGKLNLIQKSLFKLQIPSQSALTHNEKQTKKAMFRLESEDDDTFNPPETKATDFSQHGYIETLHEEPFKLEDKKEMIYSEFYKDNKSLHTLKQLRRDTQQRDGTEHKLHRVERKFERMASEILEDEAEVSKDVFNKYVSQISKEEMSDFQNEYSALCNQEIETLLLDADFGSLGSQEKTKGNVVYMAPVKLNENNSTNKAGIEVNIIPVKRTDYLSPETNEEHIRPQSDLGCYRTDFISIRDKSGRSLPNLENPIEKNYCYLGIVESILKVGPERFLVPTKCRSTSSIDYSIHELKSEDCQTSKLFSSVESLSKSLKKNATTQLSQLNVPLLNEAKVLNYCEPRIPYELTDKKTKKKNTSAIKNAIRQPCVLSSSPLGESLDHSQIATTAVPRGSDHKGDDDKPNAGAKKEKQVKDQNQLSNEMEELLEAMKESNEK